MTYSIIIILQTIYIYILLLINTMPHMIDQTQPNTKIAVLNWSKAERKQMLNDRHP